MDILEILFLSLGVSMDAFAVSICKGLSIKLYHFKYSFLCGSYFGFFQAFMPLLGYFLGIQFQDKIESIDHWVAFLLLTLIGINMIKEAFEKNEEISPDFSFSSMIPLSIATSIDALAIGITFAFLRVNVYISSFMIGFITFFISCIGVKIGHLFGIRYKSKAEISGGVILILLGFRILYEHLYFTI